MDTNEDSYEKNLPLVIILIFSFSCKKHEELHKSSCGTSAAIRDLSSQSGCGFVFELSDGSKIVAITSGSTSHTCSSHHSNDVLSNFSLADGKKVKIGFELINATPNSCGAKTAKITCIEDDNSATKD